MTTYVLIHGAADTPWSWHLLQAELVGRGHDVVVPDLPCDDDDAGLAEYADAVVDAIGERTDLVVVGHSFGAFTAPIVCERLAVDQLVLLAPMIALPGEPPGDWWANTGYAPTDGDADADADEIATFLHDVAPSLAAEALTRGRDQSATPMSTPWPLAAWPEVPTEVLICRDDRCFPAEFSRRVARERLGITPDEIGGSHCVALSRPGELADRLEAYAQQGAQMTPSYTHKQLTEVKDSAPALGLGEFQATRFATADLDARDTGFSHVHISANARPPFAHRHEHAEEVYVVLSGSGRVKLDDDVIELERLDAVRVAPTVARAFEAGPDGLELLAFGPRHAGDGELVEDFWTD